MPEPNILDFSESVLLLRALGFPGGRTHGDGGAPPVTLSRRVRDLYIGFDLGTSCSKVMIGDPEAGDTYPVSFDDNQVGIARYLLPTRFEESEDGMLEIGTVRSDFSVDDLKWRAMGAARDVEGMERATEDLAVFLALALRSVLSWFGRHLAKQYADFDICWHVNFGFPDRRPSGVLLDIYRQAARAALTAASGVGPISRRRTTEILRSPNSLAARASAFDPERTHFYPEIAAQLAGYVRSRFRKDGNLLFIDVGAGTLDVSTIIINSTDTTDGCSFHFCAVQPLGAFRLFDARHDHLGQCWADRLRRFDGCLRDGLLPLPDAFEEFLSNGEAPPIEMRKVFNKVSSEFGDRCHQAISRLIGPFRRSLKGSHRDTGYDPWPKTLRCIRSGGGSRSAFFQLELGPQLEEAMIPFTRWHEDERERRRAGQGLEFVPLPVPDDLQSDDPVVREHFDRLSVAHGLAYGIENLMTVIDAMVDPTLVQ